MGKDILIRDQIFSTYDSLYDAEKKVADYVAGHKEDVINMSVAELAQNCATSQATVIRFCKKIGCEGFHKLKLKLAGEQSKQEELAASNEINIENMEQSLHNIMVSKVEEIIWVLGVGVEMQEMLAVDVVESSMNVDVYGL